MIDRLRVRTRSLRGARLLFPALALLASLGPVPARAREPRGPGPLPWRIGHEVGFTVDAAAFPESSAYLCEVYLRVRPTLIADLCRDGREPTPIKLSARLRSAFGGPTMQREQTFDVLPADTADTFGEVVVLSFAVRPGTYRLDARMDTRRRVLARVGMEKPEHVQIEGPIVIPPVQAGRYISDLEFIWGRTSDSGSRVYGGGGRAFVPNPERLYGLYATDLRAYFVARGAPGDARPWHWIARALDAESHVLATRESAGVAEPNLASEVSLDVSSLPSGDYDLEIKAWQEGDKGALLRRSRFSVAWLPESWHRDPMSVADDAHFLLPTEEEEEHFEQLLAGEQEKQLDAFWKERDPTPETAENEARTEFLKRVNFANRTYGRYGLGLGMFSDMGRVFIRYGEPSEVIRQVMPGLDDNVLRILDDLSRSETRTLGNVAQREPGADMRPFELWVYEGEIPLPIDADPARRKEYARHKKLVFLFVDENGLGDYRMLYSGE